MATLNVLDHGADPNGGSSSDSAFQSALNSAGSGDTVYVPNGDYRLNGFTVNGTTLQGESRDGVRFIVDSSGGFITGRGGFTIENFTIDVTEPSGGDPESLSNHNVENTFHGPGSFRDVYYHGVQGRTSPVSVWHAIHDLPSGQELNFERVYMPYGGGVPNQLNGIITFLASGNWGVNGRVAFRGCHLERSSSSLMYLEEAGGLLIEDTYIANAVNACRVPGSGNTTIRNSVWDQTGSPPRQDHSNDRFDGANAARGLWNDGSVFGTITMENVDMDMTGPAGTACVNLDGGVNIDVTNCRFRNDGVMISAPSANVSGSHFTGGGQALSVGSGSVSGSCSTSGFSGVSTSNASTSGCTTPDLTPPMNLSQPYDPRLNDGSGGGGGGDGGDGGTTDPSLPPHNEAQQNTIALSKFDGESNTEPITYSFVATNAAQQVTRPWGASIDDTDTVTETETGYFHVEGQIDPGDRAATTDIFNVLGPIGLFTVDDGVDVWYNNTQADPASVVEASGGGHITEETAFGAPDDGNGGGDGGTDQPDTAGDGLGVLLLAGAALSKLAKDRNDGSGGA